MNRIGAGSRDASGRGVEKSHVRTATVFGLVALDMHHRLPDLPARSIEHCPPQEDDNAGAKEDAFDQVPDTRSLIPVHRKIRFRTAACLVRLPDWVSLPLDIDWYAPL